MEDFKITERFMPIWISALMGIALIPISYCMYDADIFGAAKGIIMSFAMLFIYLILLVLTLMKLSIVISDKNIKYHFSFFGLEGKYTEIAKAEINTITLRSFSAISEFGGYGYRFGKKGYTGYIVKGNYGIDIQYLSRKILLSLSDFDATYDVLKKYNYL